ncbi:hypothetical protein N658DRAFT_297800 [Parathielavia hyrcaniae]|uniref:Uncharacterized protein n=1 Tax=Parathielavia hyrcaniae TaxID=113614 RepID=A0AAN6T334_9PEZI|nr:hypothetical protein N658DRAFT_297800 [Parathielavia hyrcaniae]
MARVRFPPQHPVCYLCETSVILSQTSAHKLFQPDPRSTSDSMAHWTIFCRLSAYCEALSFAPEPHCCSASLATYLAGHNWHHHPRCHDFPSLSPPHHSRAPGLPPSFL